MDLAEVAKRAEQREQSLRELEDEVATLASHLYAGTRRFLELVGELDRRGQWTGCTRAQWLAWRCGLLPRAAREHVRVARRLPELPFIHAAFARGELSYSKVRDAARDQLWEGKEGGSAEPPSSAETLVAVAEATLTSASARAGAAGARRPLPLSHGCCSQLLCRRHHRLVHEGGYSVDHEGRFYDPWGQRIPPVPNAPPGDADQLLRHDHARTIGPHTCASECERMDLELQVEALAAVLYGR